MKILALDVASNLTGMAIVDFDNFKHSTKQIDSQIARDPSRPADEKNRLPNTEVVVDKKIGIIYKHIYDLSLTKQHFNKIIIEESAVFGDMGLIKFVGIYRAIIKKLLSYDEIIECMPADGHAHYPMYESRPSNMTTKDVSFKLYEMELGEKAKTEDEAEAFLIARAYETIIKVKKYRLENEREYREDKEAKKRLRKRITTAKGRVNFGKKKNNELRIEQGVKSGTDVVYKTKKHKNILLNIERYMGEGNDLNKELKILVEKGK